MASRYLEIIQFMRDEEPRKYVYKKGEGFEHVEINIKHNSRTRKLKKKIKKCKGGMNLKRNEYGVFEHFETGIVFDPATKKAYGVMEMYIENQKIKGLIIPLESKHIEICKINAWPIDEKSEKNGPIYARI